MQVTEVRLGNLVAYRDHYHTPEVVTALDKESKKINGHDTTDFNGIPLTEQWFYNPVGNTHDNHSYVDISLYPDFHLLLHFMADGVCPELIKDPELASENPQIIMLEKIDYVHEAQNLTYALTGQELELKTRSHE